MKPECPIDWKTAFTAALLGFLGAYLIGGYLNMPDAGAIAAIGAATLRASSAVRLMM